MELPLHMLHPRISVFVTLTKRMKRAMLDHLLVMEENMTVA